MLKTEQNTSKIKNEILKAARIKFKHYEIENNKIYTLFDHGHWWIMFFDETEGIDRTFDVVDAEGIGTINGYDFEEV